MRLFVERGARYLFYGIIGVSMVFVTTPSLAAALPAPRGVLLWPVIGLLAYLLHVFEDTGKLRSFPAAGGADVRPKPPGSRLPAWMSPKATSATAEQ